MKSSLALLGLTGLALTGKAHAQLIVADITLDNQTRQYEFQTYDDVEATSVDEILADFGYDDLDEVDTIRIEGSFAGQAFRYTDFRDDNIVLGMNVDDVDALFAGIKDADPNASIDEDDLRLYEAILEGNAFEITIDEQGGMSRMVIGDNAIVINYDDASSAGTIEVRGDGQGPQAFTAGAGEDGDQAILNALGDRLDEIDMDNAQLSQLLSLFTPNSISNTYDDPIAGNPTSVVGRMPGILVDMHSRELKPGRKFGFFGKLEYETVNYDTSGDAQVISGDLAAMFDLGPGALTVEVPVAYVEYDGGEEVGHLGVILGYGLTMNDFIQNMPWTWTLQGNIGAVAGTSDALVDTALVSTTGVTNRFMSPVNDKLELGWELGVNYFGSPDINIDDFSQTYNLDITGVTFGALGEYTFDNGMYVEGAIRRTEFHGDELAVDAQHELDFLVGGNDYFAAGLTYGHGDDYDSLSGQIRLRF
ncbi:MAG: hypothetical protein CMK09_10495 [Ponticaulis sp.]|nr:hypothetical protein [Ponticaulis sp.]|tara:strand:+ start:4525 stop:5952 length:1428 start_codon:yes stop_codon:yes gene_type:complete